jgi:YVTN family beta-propeller protein
MRVKIWKILGLLSIVIFMLSTAGLVHAASLTTTITTGVNPVGVVYDPAMHEIFVDNYVSGDIQVISDSTNQQVADVTALTQYAGAPFNLAYDSVKGEIWVADATGAYAISDVTNQIVANVSDTNGLELAAFDPKTAEVFMYYNGVISVISDSTNTITASLTQSVTGIVDDSAKSEIFAGQDTGGQGSAVVYVISAKTNAVTASIPVTGTPQFLAYDSGKGEIFVAGSNFESTEGITVSFIQVISDSTNKVVATINLPTSVGLGYMAYNPNKGEIYINDITSIGIISDSTNNVVGTVDTNGTNYNTGSSGIAYDSGTSTVYAVNDQGSTEGFMGSLAVISDPSSGTSTPSPTSTASSSPSTSASTGSTPTPSVPEFSSVAIISVAAAMVAVTLCTVALRARTRKALPK